ncbi:hypothetical protein [Candidatus Avelusimicrobium alvi]|uniref:hypothetical protein n=2 Tax=Candidatus Avelusimicrobium alvi TaxID=3416221 RepID=UPI003D14DBBD
MKLSSKIFFTACILSLVVPSLQAELRPGAIPAEAKNTMHDKAQEGKTEAEQILTSAVNSEAKANASAVAAAQTKAAADAAAEAAASTKTRVKTSFDRASRVTAAFL